MSDKMKFIWIDDLPSRKGAAENLSHEFDADFNFVDVSGKNPSNEIAEVLRGAEPDLIVIDHKLQNTEGGFYQNGSTAATIIREVWPVCPIVCVSGVDLLDFTLEQRNLYEAVFPDSKISDHYSTIHSIVQSFKCFRNSPPSNIDELVAFFGGSSDDQMKLKSILPPAIKDNIGDAGIIRIVCRWVISVLFERPGFLYDDLWSATFLGLKLEGFKTVLTYFDDAQYNGLFADSTKPRWWKSVLFEILTKQVSSHGLPWEMGRGLPGVEEHMFSTCYISNEPFPETVAFIDETHKGRFPMKLKFTSPDNSFQDSLFFEGIRKYSNQV